jgi:RNA polymerase sigma factor (TIGR02999 family)
MTQIVSDELSHFFNDISQNRTDELDRLMPLVYKKVRRLAQKHLQSERPDHTLSATALVNETYIKLHENTALEILSEREFYALASHYIRNILVDYARVKNASKRNNGQKPLQLDDSNTHLETLKTDDIYALDIALSRLKETFPRGCQIVHYRLFGGLNLEETAKIMEVSTKTVQRDWTAAIAWLRKEAGGVSAPKSSLIR